MTLRCQMGYVGVRIAPCVSCKRLSTDGTLKASCTTSRGLCLESVLMPMGWSRELTLCASTQVGCAVRCRFCATGRRSCAQRLYGSEIAGQAVRASSMLGPALRNGATYGYIVLMGMGEPMLNYGAMVRALAVIAACGLHGVRSTRDITASTSGIAPALYRLCRDMPVSIALSLHLHDGLARRLLVPCFSSNAVLSMVDSCCYYLRVGGACRVTVESCMVRDISDRLSQANGMARSLARLSCMVNIIPMNSMGSGVYSPPRSKCTAWFALAAAQGLSAIVPRIPRGLDVRAACGQLRA
ncbi:Dual-specificity RNA methyltransferase RlmN [Candidatus Tremblaya princeps]|uniref:Dual-specificity RNA methyltransferase RlmN n=1 Tax=Tremblaya princeps TaxID=189385 RepID=A0A1C3K978_TREPR|nr:Dual-specificity RNA methyltransferase RlmN [Candidatus Tremblaya princeps]